MWEVGSLLRSTDAGAPATREVADPANQAALHNSKLLEKEHDNAERGRDFRSRHTAGQPAPCKNASRTTTM